MLARCNPLVTFGSNIAQVTITRVGPGVIAALPVYATTFRRFQLAQRSAER